MTLERLTFTSNRSTEQDIHSHLAQCDQRFVPRLSERLDVGQYCKKIRSKAHTFEAWNGVSLVGLVAAYVDASRRSCFITNVSVLAAFAGKGVASKLLSHCLEQARTGQIKTVSLEVSEEAQAAGQLYARHGFHEIGRRPGVVSMQCVLEQNLTGHQLAGSAAVRNHDREYQDNAERKYTYDFDTVIRQYLLRTLLPHFRRDGSALELGCYKGDMTEQILGYFPAVDVIEAASELAEIVRERFPGRVRVLTSTFETARVERTYDHIFIVHTLEHLDDPIGILAKVRSWLTTTGRLFVAVPNANALSRQIAVKMGLVDHNSAVTPAEAEHGHRRTYSMDVLLSHVRHAGYRIVDFGGVVVKPFANFQFDLAIAQGIVNTGYLDACNELAKAYPDLSASLFVVCERAD